MKVYIVYNYDESGPQNVHATLNKDRVLDLIHETFGEDAERDSKLETVLEQDECTDRDWGESLERWWGGVKIHIVELE